MKTFKEYITEGTSATITVLEKGIYKTSILQYDGYESFMIPELKKFWSKPKDAGKLVKGTGELRGVYDGKEEYYTDRKLLQVTKKEDIAIRNINESYIKYYYNGDIWFSAKGTVRELSDMIEI